MPVIPAFSMLRQEDLKFEISTYITPKSPKKLASVLWMAAKHVGF